MSSLPTDSYTYSEYSILNPFLFKLMMMPLTILSVPQRIMYNLKIIKLLSILIYDILHT